MFGKKKAEDEKEIARSAMQLWAFTKAVLVFVEEDPNRVRSFLKVMTDINGQPRKEDIQAVRSDLSKCIAWVSQSMAMTEEKLGAKNESK